MSVASAKLRLQNAFRWRAAELRRRTAELPWRWPVYDAWRYLKNAQARRLYGQARMLPTATEQVVIDTLRRDGIAVIPITDLVPGLAFDAIQAWAEGLLSAPAVQEQIDAIQSGAKPAARSGKYYIVRPLGELPAFDVSDAVVRAALSDPILRVVSGYLGVFSRVCALDLWYNVPSTGPEMLSQRWHRDPEDRALIKTFLYLRDCDETQGPFCYVPGTHNAGPFEHKVARSNYPPEGVVDQRFPPERRRICTGKAGTLVLCDTTGFHKGGHATGAPRFLFNAMYATDGSEAVTRWVPPCTLTGARSHLGDAARYAVNLLEPANLP